MSYEKLFDMLDLAERSGILSSNAIWQVSCGEIAIHPYRDRIMELVRGKAVAYLLALCYKNGISNDMFTYTEQEQLEAVQQANAILRAGKI